MVGEDRHTGEERLSLEAQVSYLENVILREYAEAISIPCFCFHGRGEREKGTHTHTHTSAHKRDRAPSVLETRI